jgi:hypothetical protein
MKQKPKATFSKYKNMFPTWFSQTVHKQFLVTLAITGQFMKLQSQDTSLSVHEDLPNLVKFAMNFLQID